MSGHDVAKQVKLYKIIGAILIVGTIITVMASNVHLGIILGIIVVIFAWSGAAVPRPPASV